MVLTLIGSIELAATPPRVWIEEAQVFPDLAQKRMLIKVRIGNVTGRSGTGTLTAIWPDIGVVRVNWDEHTNDKPSGGTVSTVSLGCSRRC